MEKLIKNNIFYIHHMRTTTNQPVHFALHQHNHPEIYFFISGECEFIFEGSSYTLSPYDAIIVPPNTIHQTLPTRYVPYIRYTLYPYPDFYKQYNWNSEADTFKKISAQNAKIPGSIIKNTDIVNILHKFSKYSNDYKNTDQLILNHLFYEIMYILNSITDYESCDKKNMIVQDVIEYINENYIFISNIDEISAALNYSKSYLSALFKKNVGITVHDYIVQKRLANTELLYRNGENLTAACLKSGFPSYNNFAHAYKQLHKKSPKSGIKK